MPLLAVPHGCGHLVVQAACHCVLGRRGRGRRNASCATPAACGRLGWCSRWCAASRRPARVAGGVLHAVAPGRLDLAVPRVQRLCALLPLPLGTALAGCPSTASSARLLGTAGCAAAAALGRRLLLLGRQPPLRAALGIGPRPRSALLVNVLLAVGGNMQGVTGLFNRKQCFWSCSWMQIVPQLDANSAACST